MTSLSPITIGKAVRDNRYKKNYSQVGLGKLVNTSRQTILSIETGLSNPRFAVAYRLAKCLGFSLDSVIPNDTDDSN